MQMALYDDEHGYYRKDVFGRDGDFYTASQLQPVFGALVRAMAADWSPGYERVIDIGAGRGEVGEGFGAGAYVAIGHGENIPKTNHGVLFSNELIDAMPVEVWQFEHDRSSMLRVQWSEDRGAFEWYPHEPRPGVIEKREGVKRHLEEAYAAIDHGVYIVIDYGYKARERMRFERGSLMSYRKHVASEDVLRDVGMRDITAHVDWDAFELAAREVGWVSHGVKRLGAAMLDLGPHVLESLFLLGEKQLKALLFDFGESFDVVVLEKR